MYANKSKKRTNVCNVEYVIIIYNFLEYFTFIISFEYHWMELYLMNNDLINSSYMI